MEVKKSHNKQQKRFPLSLKKNKECKKEVKKCVRESDIKVFDDSFDRLQAECAKSIQPKVVLESPIQIDDSCDEIRTVLPVNEEPSKCGNVSFNSSKNFTSPNKASVPSFNGWSPRQDIICATPKTDTIPSSSKDKANESTEECSLKQIRNSQLKLLNHLYGDSWKSLPVFKSIVKKHENLTGVQKHLNFDNEDSEKENVNHKKIKEMYLINSETKITKTPLNGSSNEEKNCKKKLYTEKIPSTPDLPKQKAKAKSSTKKSKQLTVTELVGTMSGDVDWLRKSVQKVSLTPKQDVNVNRLSFVASIADNIPSWRCHPEAIQYHDDFKGLKEKLARRLFTEFNKVVFDNALDADMPILWDTKLRSTAGTTTNRLIRTRTGVQIRTSSIKLSTKVIDCVQRVRDTLIHELCHAATWLIDAELKAGHGPLWKKWAKKALKDFPELGEIERCHTMEIHYKYSYKCTQCGYSIKRHSKSIDITQKCCGYCRGKFEIIVNKKTKDGVVVSTPARKGGLNDFALYVKENYGSVKKQGKTHADVMKMLGEQFSARKKQNSETERSSEST